MLYEHKKHTGELPIIGVNTYLNPRADEEGYRIPDDAGPCHQAGEGAADRQPAGFPGQTQARAPQALKRLQQAAELGDNIFAELMRDGAGRLPRADQRRPL